MKVASRECYTKDNNKRAYCINCYEKVKNSILGITQQEAESSYLYESTHKIGYDVGSEVRLKAALGLAPLRLSYY